MRIRRERTKKPKPVAYELIARDDVIGFPIYQLMERLIQSHHQHLGVAKIVIAWGLTWKPDVDGRVVLGKCKIASDLDRALADYDIVIILRRVFWKDDLVTNAQRTALLDHELCHAQRKLDSQGNAIFDERQRPVFRIRKHDIEEFTEIVARHGAWKEELDTFARQLLRNPRAPHRPCAQCAPLDGWIMITDLTGTDRKQRCPCYVRWAERRRELELEHAV